VTSGPHVLAIVLAGGEGKRLMPLTADRAKPAVPFGGSYRLVDFVLSNLINAGLRRVCVLTQYKSHSLDRHITTTWPMPQLLGDYVTPVPAQQRLGPRWFTGSADAIFQSLNLIHDEGPEYVAVFGADHVYRMDPMQMIRQHIDSGAGVTVAGLRTPRSLAHQFGVIETADDGLRVRRFIEKPLDPPAIPGSPDLSYVSMGNYIFSTSTLIDVLRADAADASSAHDMGASIIPMLTEQGLAHVYDFAGNDVPGTTERDRGYWRDVGTLEAYWKANLDLASVTPELDMYDQNWPIRTHMESLPPAKFVQDRSGSHGMTLNSLVSGGCIISGSVVVQSVLFPRVRINSFCNIDSAVLLPDVWVGRSCRLRRCVIDRACVIPEGMVIGENAEEDARRFYRSEEGIVLVTREMLRKLQIKQER